MAAPGGEIPTYAPVSLRANVAANYASQVFVALAAILMMPFYLRRMGAEAYGLIGFFTLMNAWFQILDAGLSLTLTRESARYRGGVIDAPTLRALFGLLERVFLAIAVAGALVIAAGAHLIAASWLRVTHLPLNEVAAAVMLMGLTAPLQWATGLYRGVLNGFERQVWLAAFNAGVAAVRFGGAAVAIAALGPDPLTFFSYQLAVSTAELLALVGLARLVLPKVGRAARRRLGRQDVRDLLAFSGSLAFAVTVWILVTQLDKLLLSKILPLADYGIFSLAVAAASGILLLGGPVAQALLPRLTHLSASGDGGEAIRLYRVATQFVCLLTAPAALVLAAFSREAVFVWTGDAHAAAAVAPILTPYALGNGVVTIGALPYFLQYARGDLRLHVIGNAIMAALMIPAIVAAASRYGAVGSGYAWLAVNSLYFLAWVPWVHRRMQVGLHLRWLFKDVLPPAASAAAAVFILSRLFAWLPDRLMTTVGLAVCGLLTLLAAAGSSPVARDLLQRLVRGLVVRLVGRAS